MHEVAASSSGAPKQPVHVDQKIGRNDKVKLISPSGKQVDVKYKKFQQLLNQEYTQV